jgi:hypothetical protein
MKTTIDMAREVGLHLATEVNWMPIIGLDHLKAFEALVRADEREETNRRANASWTLMCEKMVATEREACAKVCDEYSATGKIEEFDRGWLACAKNTAAAIRARGNT